MPTRRALIVHDDPSTATALAMELAQEGYRVDIVDSGLAAIRRVWEHRYERVLIDQGLRGMSAHDLTLHIGNLAPTSRVEPLRRRAAA